ncbi:MAG: lysoplasmalogenase [Streptosporangiales bacterium]|nr:lysoplasmalogenase [Streptosporangiales bacterium]
MTGDRRLLALVPYAAAGVIHLVALAAAVDGLGTVTKVLLMPTLALALLVLAGEHRGHWTWGTAIALVLAWAGDLALNVPRDVWFLVGLAAFLLAHLVYVGVFWPFTRRSGLRRRPWAAIPYTAWWVVLLAVLAPGLGDLVVPVAIYGLVLGASATVAVGVNRTVAWGAGIFLVSDSLLALHRYADWFAVPQPDVWVMATYIAGQGLIVLGLVRAGRARPARRLRPSDARS